MNTLFDACRLTLLASLIATTGFAAGCSSKQVAPETDVAMSAMSSMPESLSSESIAAEYDEAEYNEAEYDEASLIDASRPARLTFNFGFNQAALDADNQKIIEQHGRFLAEHPELKLVINGHSDKQGNSRYNDVLSQKRAEYVADLLMSQGAMLEQIEILSWGSSAPLATATHFRDQRRVDIQYLDEYLVQSTTP